MKSLQTYRIYTVYIQFWPTKFIVLDVLLSCLECALAVQEKSYAYTHTH